MTTNVSTYLDQLRLPFHPSQVSWKPGVVKGDRALALAYADLRAYMNRLDEVCGDDWSVSYEPWGNDRLICRLIIAGVIRSSTGETDADSTRNEIGGTVAEAMAFKRACAMFGLGRYLYNLPTGWADYDPATKKFTANAQFKLTGILVQHYRRATGNGPTEVEEVFSEDASEPGPQSTPLLDQFNELGQALYGDQWEKVCRRNVNRISGGKTQRSSELTPEQMQQLIVGMMKLKDKRADLAA